MSEQLARFAGDVPRALAAYNWGPERAAKWDGDRSKLPAETQQYINRILGPQPEGPFRDRIHAAIAENPNLAPETKSAMLSDMDERAISWAQREGSTPEEWYSRYVADADVPMVGGDSHPLFDVLQNERGGLFQNPPGIGNIPDLYDFALADKTNRKAEIKYATVDPEESARIKKETGLDVPAGYEHSIDTYAIRHMHEQHGDLEVEGARGQIAVTREDISKIPEVVKSPDRTEPIRTKKGRDGIGYTKKINGQVFYIEEIRTKRNQLAAVSIRISKAGSPKLPGQDQSVASNLPESLPAKTRTSETLHVSDIDTIATQIESGKTGTAEAQISEGAALEKSKAPPTKSDLRDPAIKRDFNKVLKRLGGKALTRKDVPSRSLYKRKLKPEQLAAYHRAYALWNEHGGDIGKIYSSLDALDAEEKKRISLLDIIQNERGTIGEGKLITFRKKIEELKGAGKTELAAKVERMITDASRRSSNPIMEMNREYDRAAFGVSEPEP